MSPQIYQQKYYKYQKDKNIYQILFKMKNSWIKIQQNGRMPPNKIIPNNGLANKDCLGACRGI